MSKDPDVQPEIDPNYMDEDIDLEIFVDALKLVRRVAAQDAWKAVTDGELLPGPSVVTDEQIRGACSPLLLSFPLRSHLAREKKMRISC